MKDTFNVFISNCKMSREFCHSLMGSRHRGYCHKNHLGIRAGSLFKILVAREQIEGASGNRAPVRQQPGHVQGIIHHSPLPPPVLAARCHCQRAKKVVSDSPGPVDFARAVFWGNSNYRRIVINPANQKARFWS